jgi:hypothetical protein
MTLVPCWYCSGLIRQFQIGNGIAESVNFQGDTLTGFSRTASRWSISSQKSASSCYMSHIEAHPGSLNEDIGEE